MKFSKSYLSKARDTDFAGHQYFGHLLNLSHDFLEDFIIESGIGWKEWFKSDSYIAPVVATESNYLKSIIAGEQIEAQLGVEKVGNTSVAIKFVFQQNAEEAANSKIVFVFVDKESGKKISIPENIKSILQKYA